MRQLTDLKGALSNDPIAAVSLFDRILQEEEDEARIEELHKSSLLCRLYLSFQFRSFRDTTFPRRLIFKGRSLFDGSLQWEPHRRHHIIAVGSNRYFNLGVHSDGSPVDEPRLVNVQSLKTMRMTNTHTIFLAADNQLFGCGKAASFLPNCIEEKDGGYVALPTRIQIPDVSSTDAVMDIRVTEGGSQFLIGDYWYLIGKSPKLPNKRKIASNCFVSTDREFNPVRTPLSANVPLGESHVKIYMTLSDGILFWDREPSFNAKKEAAVIVNGCPIHDHFQHFQVLEDGTIYGSKNNLLKGKLQFWKNIDDGFIVKNRIAINHFDTKYTLMALMEEVPGTIGTEFFSVSPDGRNIIMKMGYQNEKKINEDGRKFKSLHTHLIIKERLEKEGDPVDIPTDLMLFFHYGSEQVVKYETNSVVFDMMHPELKGEKNEQNEIHFCHGHPPSFRIEYEVNLIDYTFNINLDRPRRPLTPEDLNTEFVPNGTDPNMVWELITTDKTRISCHKYLLLLHSRQMGGMQRFLSNQVYGCYQFEEPREEAMEIIAEASSDTVRNALRGMINPATLFNLKAIDLIECIRFYDYHLMQEMFDDAMYALMEIMNDFTLQNLYELYSTFDNKVIEGLCERPHLLFNSIITSPPPRSLILQFVERMEAGQSTPNGSNITPCDYNPEDVIKYFLDLDQDFEDVLWRSVREDFGGMLETWRQEALRRKEERKAARSRNNSLTYRPEASGVSMVSAPIPISSERKKNCSESFDTPTQSPSTFSLTSLVKNLPSRQIRNNSISNSLEDFPVMSPAQSPSTSAQSKVKSPGGRFVPKGTRFVNANQILKPLAAPNVWKTPESAIKEETPVASVNFQDVIQKEEKLQKNLKTGFKKVQLLPNVETEQMARAEILEMYRRDYQDEALICVELILTEDADIDSEQIIWGNMPGLLRR